MNIFGKAYTQLEKIHIALKNNVPAMELIAQNYADVYSHISTWQDNGSNTFVLSNSLVEAFQNTDVPQDVKPSDFRYPYNSFVIENDNGLFPIHIIPGEIFQVKAVICNLREAFANQNMKLMTENGGLIDGTYDKLKWKLMIVGIFFHNDPIFGEALETVCMALGDDQKIENMRDNGVRRFHYDLDEDDVKNISNIVFNTVAYLTDPNRIVVETEEHRTRSFKIQTESSKKEFTEQRYVFLRPPKRYISSETYLKSGKTFDKRFWVRGHWRWQACGHLHSERRHTWILPYQKGPVESKGLTKTYILDK